jgi:hypothetical protein
MITVDNCKATGRECVVTFLLSVIPNSTRQSQPGLTTRT